MTKPNRWLALVLMAEILIGARLTQAASYSWTNTAGGAWSTTTSWDPVGAPSTVNDAAAFTNAALAGQAFTVSLTGNATASNAFFNANGAVITLNLGNNTLNFASTFNTGGPVNFSLGTSANATTT